MNTERIAQSQEQVKGAIETSDGRLITEEDILRLKTTQSWSSLIFPNPFGYDIPYINARELIGQSEPKKEWITAPGTKELPSIIYCTWQTYGKRISLEAVENQLEAMEEHKVRPDIFIIDDGWQSHSGDWEEINTNKFPGEGMTKAAELIRSQNISPWLWWGVLNVSKNSNLIKEHPDWVAQNPKTGNPKLMGLHEIAIPDHFVLDPRNPEAWEYLEEVASKIKEWGFDGIKADFLGSTFVIPGMSPQEALEYDHRILELIKNNDLKVEACGCPFGAAVGVADFCRVSNDSGIPHSVAKGVKGIPNRIAEIFANPVMATRTLAGVLDNSELLLKFGVRPDPDMLHTEGLGRGSYSLLLRAQRKALDYGGSLTLGFDFTNISERDLKLTHQLINRVERVRTRIEESGNTYWNVPSHLK